MMQDDTEIKDFKDADDVTIELGISSMMGFRDPVLSSLRKEFATWRRRAERATPELPTQWKFLVNELKSMDNRVVELGQRRVMQLNQLLAFRESELETIQKSIREESAYIQLLESRKTPTLAEIQLLNKYYYQKTGHETNALLLQEEMERIRALLQRIKKLYFKTYSYGVQDVYRRIKGNADQDEL